MLIKEDDKVKFQSLSSSEVDKLSGEIHRLIMIANDGYMLGMDRLAYVKVSTKIVGIIDRVLSERK